MINFLEKAISLALSIASRGLKGHKASPEEKQLRVLSCFGNGEIGACQYLKKSDHFDSYYCNGCGCGDKEYTQLLINGEKYSKLDYPYLTCPLQMPGFSNYNPSSPKDLAERSRKIDIENFELTKLQSIQVSSPDPTPEEYIIFQELSKKKE